MHSNNTPMLQHAEQPIIAIQNLMVSYHKQPVLQDINLALPQGKLIGIIGPNGAGKSTLLKTIMELVPADQGCIKLWGQSLAKVRKQVSYVPQKESVDWDFPATVQDVVMMGRYSQLRLFQRPRKVDQKITMECLTQVGLAPFAKRQIAQLSGGQQQRVFLARALAQEAQLYLMDEPFVGVDAATEQQIITLLQAMACQGKTILIVHHELQSVTHYFDWSILLNRRVVAVGPTQAVFTPEQLQATYSSNFEFLYQIAHRSQAKGTSLTTQ